MKKSTLQILLTVGLVVSLSLNITQYLVVGTQNKSNSSTDATQTMTQKMSALEDKLSEREQKIKELQNTMKENTNTGNSSETTSIDNQYTKVSTEFAKLALGGKSSTEDYSTKLKPLVTDELYTRMTSVGDGEKNGQSSIRLSFSSEEAYLNYNSMHNNQAKVFVKLHYHYQSEQDEKVETLSESKAYMLLTVQKQGDQLKVINYEMG